MVESSSSFYQDEATELYVGDCALILPTMQPESVDTVITDPPYHLTPQMLSDGRSSRCCSRKRGFMDSTWDGGSASFDVALWGEILRVVKPGGYLLAFGAPRTFHRLAAALEDAGWLVRDCLLWLYGTGFPKSHDIGMALRRMSHDDDDWEGWGTSLKPAWEPILMVMKPLHGSYASNALKYGVAGLHIDGARVGPDRIRWVHSGGQGSRIDTSARWPANVLISHSEKCQQGSSLWVPSTSRFPSRRGPSGIGAARYGGQIGLPRQIAGWERVEQWRCEPDCPVRMLAEQHQTATRFFYVDKASRRDRDAGLPAGVRNTHPTVKPIRLMEHLCRLTSTPSRGIVLDPFAGSGTTLLAARNCGRRSIGIELNAEYAAIARSRLIGCFANGNGH